MFKKAALIVVIALISAVPSAQAQGWYLGAFGSFSDTDDTSFGTALGTVKTTFDSDMSYGLVFGYDTSKVRIEGEITSREADVKDHILGGDALPGPTGDAESLSIMGNLIYDFNRDGAVQPYIGVGLGWTDVELSEFGVAPIPDVLQDSDSSFAYQFLAGLGFGLGDSAWDLFIDYRWFVADSLSLTVSEAAGAVSSDVDYEVQDIVIGLRYSF
jgi:OOP family OmpA-OmpF porin